MGPYHCFLSSLKQYIWSALFCHLYLCWTHISTSWPPPWLQTGLLHIGGEERGRQEHKKFQAYILPALLFHGKQWNFIYVSICLSSIYSLSVYLKSQRRSLIGWFWIISQSDDRYCGWQDLTTCLHCNQKIETLCLADPNEPHGVESGPLLKRRDIFIALERRKVWWTEKETSSTGSHWPLTWPFPKMDTKIHFTFIRNPPSISLSLTIVVGVTQILRLPSANDKCLQGQSTMITKRTDRAGRSTLLLLGQFVTPGSVCHQGVFVLTWPCQLWNLIAFWTCKLSAVTLHECYLFPSWCFGIFHVPSASKGPVLSPPPHDRLAFHV